MKKLKKLIFSRVFVVGVLILMQLLMILSMTIEFTKYFIVYYAVMFVLAFVFVLKIINTNQNMAYKLAWIVVVFIFPAFGVALYMIFSGNRLSNRSIKKMRFMEGISSAVLGKGENVVAELAEDDKNAEKRQNTSATPQSIRHTETEGSLLQNRQKRLMS